MKRQHMSELMDDELKGEEAERLIDGICRDPKLMAQWERYHLIRAALSNHLTPHVGPELLDRVRGAVEREPSHLLELRRRRHRIGQAAGGFALAASLFGVAIVSGQWLAGGDGFDNTVPVAGVTSSPVANGTAGQGNGGMRWQQVDPDFERRLNAFLVSHSTYSDHMSPMRPYARVVSYHGAP